MSAQIQTTLHALRVVYPAMALILVYEMSTKIFKTPLISAIALSYGPDSAPLVSGGVTAATYFLQLITAPIWGRLADAGFPRLTLGAAIVAPLVPCVAILFGPNSNDTRPVIVLFNITAVLSGLCGAPLAVAFNLSKSLLKLREVTSSKVTARAMLLVMSCVPLGVLSGIGISVLVGHRDTFQATLNALSLTSVVLILSMAVFLYLSGPMAPSFLLGLKKTEASTLDDVLLENNEENKDAEEAIPRTSSLEADNVNGRLRGDSVLDDVIRTISRDVPAPSFHNPTEEEEEEEEDRRPSPVRFSKCFFVLRWLRNPQFLRLALAFAFVELGHEGYFAEHGTSFKLSFPTSHLLPAVMMLGAGLNAFNILFFEPLVTYCGATPPTKAILATVSMVLCYTMWSFGNLKLTFVGEFVGLMALMFKPSVTFMMTTRLSGEEEMGEAIGALHGFGMCGAMLGIVVAAFSVSAFGSFGLLMCAAGPLMALICLVVDQKKQKLKSFTLKTSSLLYIEH